MDRENCGIHQIVRNIAAVILMFAVGLATIGCGEAVSIDGIDTGGGSGGGTNSLMVNWTAPTTNEDGSNLEDLAGYRLYYGTRSGQYSQVITVGTYTTAEIGNLESGTYYLAVTAYDIFGNESDFSEEINYTFF